MVYLWGSNIIIIVYAAGGRVLHLDVERLLQRDCTLQEGDRHDGDRYARLLPISHHFIAFRETKIHIYNISMIMIGIIAIKNHEKYHIDETLTHCSICQMHRAPGPRVRRGVVETIIQERSQGAVFSRSSPFPDPSR